MSEKTALKMRVLAVVLVAVLAVSMLWIETVPASAELPQPLVRFDQTAGKVMVLGTDGAYKASEDFAVSAVGTGIHYDDEGVVSKKAIGFSDQTSYLEFTAKNGKRFGGSEGTTVTFWMKETEAANNNYETFIVAQSPNGPIGAICSDAVQLYPYGDASARWYAKPSNFYADGISAVGFRTSVEWCKFTAVITSDGIKIYRNDVLWYDFSGSDTAMAKSVGETTPKRYPNEVAAALCEAFAAENGSFRLRGALYTEKNTSTSRFDDLKIYPQALTAEQVQKVYEQDLSASFVFDPATGTVKAPDGEGNFAATSDFTVETVGSGAHYNDEGFLSEKALGFNDATTYLEFKAKNGKVFGGNAGTTVTFWMRETVSNTDHFESFIVSQGADGASAVLCSDSLQLFPYPDAEDRWYAKMSNFYPEGVSASKFSKSVEWCKYTAVITETDIKVYYNETLWYDYAGEKALNKSAGATTPKRYASEVAKALYEGFSAENGFFRLRGAPNYSAKNTTTSRFDEIKIYPRALSAAQVQALYEQDLAQEQALPQPTVWLDNATGKLMVPNGEGFAEATDYTVETVGTGAHYNDEGYLSEKALGFSDQTTYLNFTAKNGKTFGGTAGTTVSFWMKGTAEGTENDVYETAIVTHGTNGAEGVLCTDSMLVFPTGDTTERWYVKTANFRADGAGSGTFARSETWCKYTAVITETDVKIYYNDALLYTSRADRELARGTGDSNVKHYHTEVVTALFEGLSATNGQFSFRGGLWNKRNTSTTRFDGLKIYSEALSAEQIKALYEEDLPNELPQESVLYDTATGTVKTPDAEGNYVAATDYTVETVGTGAHYDDKGYLSQKALGFNDQTTYLEFKATNGKTFGGTAGTTVSFWMKGSAENASSYETVFVTQKDNGAMGALCTDSMLLFPYGDASARWYVKSANFYADGISEVYFTKSEEWCKYTAVITETDIKIYHNNVLWYSSSAEKELARAAGASTPKHYHAEVAKALFDGFSAENGWFRFRGAFWSDKNSTTTRFDEIKVYPEALSAAQVGMLYTEDAARREAMAYSITYELNGGTLENPVTEYTTEESFKLPVPTREGYVFDGWYRTKELRGSITMIYKEQKGHLTVYAGWKAIEYPVTYQLDGGINNGENPTVISLDSGTVTLKPALKNGYVFDGWYFGDEAVTELQAGDEAIELTAKWKVFLGDTNKDGRVAVYDAVYLLRALAGLETVTESECDYDKDEALTVGDVQMLLRHIDGVQTLVP